MPDSNTGTTTWKVSAAWAGRRLNCTPEGIAKGWPWEVLKYDDMHIVSRFVKFTAPGKFLDDQDRIKDELDRLTEEAGLVNVGEVWKKFDPQGVTGLILCETSHVAIHTWPEEEIAYLSLASCNVEVEPEPVIDAFMKRIGGKVLREEKEAADDLAESEAQVVAEAQDRARSTVALLERWAELTRDLEPRYGHLAESGLRSILRGLPKLARTTADELSEHLDEQAEEYKGDDVWDVTAQVHDAVHELLAFIPPGSLRMKLEDVYSWSEHLIQNRGSLEKSMPYGGGTTAPVYPSGERRGPSMALEEVLEHVKPIVLRSPAVVLVGGLANQGATRNDIDLLIRGPLDDQTAEVIRFRLGRMFPPELNKRIQFLDDDRGGPFTNYVDLYDLVLVPRGQFEVKEMAIEKQDHLLAYPTKKGKLRSTLQYHFRGASLHADWRVRVNGHLIGWTLAMQKPGLPDVKTIAEAKKIARTFKPQGSKSNKRILSPGRVYATPKGVVPLEWLDVAPHKFPPGEVGATSEKAGVIVEVDRPMAEFGAQKDDFHEYFLTKSKHGFEGRLVIRRVAGGGGTEEEEEEGRATPAGEKFWIAMIAKTSLPAVIGQDEVDNGWMPPDGQSAMPTSLMAITPPEHRFWTAKGAKARKMRDALVESGFFTTDNIHVVNGEFARMETKTTHYMSEQMAAIVGVVEES